MKLAFYNCAPCSVKYNYILKVETFNEDYDYVMKKIGVKNYNSNAQSHSTNKSSGYSSSHLKYYKNLPKDQLYALYYFVKRDAILFDYEIPDFIIEAAKSFKDKKTKFNFQRIRTHSYINVLEH